MDYDDEAQNKDTAVEEEEVATTKMQTRVLTMIMMPRMKQWMNLQLRTIMKITKLTKNEKKKTKPRKTTKKSKSVDWRKP